MTTKFNLEYVELYFHFIYSVMALKKLHPYVTRILQRISYYFRENRAWSSTTKFRGVCVVHRQYTFTDFNERK